MSGRIVYASGTPVVNAGLAKVISSAATNQSCAARPAQRPSRSAGAGSAPPASPGRNATMPASRPSVAVEVSRPTASPRLEINPVIGSASWRPGSGGSTESRFATATAETSAAPTASAIATTASAEGPVRDSAEPGSSDIRLTTPVPCPAAGAVSLDATRSGCVNGRDARSWRKSRASNQEGPAVRGITRHPTEWANSLDWAAAPPAPPVCFASVYSGRGRPLPSGRPGLPPAGAPRRPDVARLGPGLRFALSPSTPRELCPDGGRAQPPAGAGRPVVAPVLGGPIRSALGRVPSCRIVSSCSTHDERLLRMFLKAPYKGLRVTRDPATQLVRGIRGSLVDAELQTNA